MATCHPIETAPDRGEFLAETLEGDWRRAARYLFPTAPANSVLNYRTGRLWVASRWMPIPDAARGE